MGSLKDKYNKTPLKDAIVLGHHECVKILSKRPSGSNQATIAAAWKKYQGKKAPPLCAALKAKDEDAVEALLDGEADPNEVDGDGRNALHIAAREGCRLPLFHRI